MIKYCKEDCKKKPIGIKIEGQDPYKEISDIVEEWCEKHYYGSALVTISVDECIITEYLSFNSCNMQYEWAMDWWEGERDIVLLGFRMMGDVIFYGYPDMEEDS